MILFAICDGLRPDLVSPETTPFLAESAARGVFCRASHAAYPTATRINSASLTTGCYPEHHGIVDNELYVPAVDRAQAISCADWRALQALADSERGPLLTVPTLGDILRQQGLGMVSGGSGSPGTTYLTNPTLAGPIVNWAVTWPEAERERCEREFGGPLPATSSSAERGRYVMDILAESFIPRYRPDLVTLWLTEPDHAQHAHGLGAPESMAALREVDAALEQFVTRLTDQAGDDGLTCFVLSDHGFSTIDQRIDVEAELVRAGLKEAPDSTDVVRAACSLYVQAPHRLPEIVRFLEAQPWLGALFLRDDVQARCPWTMSQSAVFGGHPRSAEILFSYRWSQDTNAHGIPGCAANSSRNAATHGSVSPYDLHNTLIAWGAGIRQGLISDTPCGIVDLAPTALHLLNLSPPDAMQGRILRELLAEGAGLSPSTVSHQSSQASWASPLGQRIQTATYSVVDGHRYLDRVELVTQAR